jgi:4a-hydroxytetrahydrobiopterin dehydratase
VDQRLTRQQASDAVSAHGWRFLLGRLVTSVSVGSLAQAAEVAARVVSVCGDDADAHLSLDLRPGRVVLYLRSVSAAAVTARDVDLARRVSAALGAVGSKTQPGGGDGATRSVHMLEIAIDALDIAAVRPFWKAVLDYVGEAGADGPTDPLVDPVGQGPVVWFQQMSQARPQRNRVHLDISVPHDEAPGRIAAALAAGGRLVSGDHAPSFWVLADVEGNEACVATWQGRDG